MNDVRNNAWLVVTNGIEILLTTTRSSLVQALIRAALKMLDEAKDAEKSLDSGGNDDEN